jgi:hypothetical protein
MTGGAAMVGPCSSADGRRRRAAEGPEHPYLPLRVADATLAEPYFGLRVDFEKEDGFFFLQKVRSCTRSDGL